MPVHPSHSTPRLPRYRTAWEEQRRSTDDGLIWPFARADMTAGPCIRERMADDIRAIAKDAGEYASIADDALVALGWTPDQVRIYGDRAARQANRLAAENDCGNDPVMDGAA